MKKSKLAAAAAVLVAASLLLAGCNSGGKPPQTPTQPSTLSPSKPGSTGSSGSTQPEAQPANTNWLPNHRTVVTNKAEVVFLNPDHGWKMVYGLSAMMSESVDLYDTTDGGKNWTKIAVAGPTHTSATGSASLPAGTLPYGGIKNGLSFVSTTTGWVTGYVPAVNYPWIFVTHDGGHTWVHQELPVPKNIAHYTSMTFDLTPPAFFTSKDGILVEQIADVPRGIAHPTYVFFFTQDGGRTWVDQPSSTLKLSFPASDPKQSGQSFSVTVNGITWHTVDRGYTWTK